MNVKQIISYWQKSIIDAGSFEINSASWSNSVEISNVDFNSWRLPLNITNNLFQNYNKWTKEKSGDEINILISPFQINSKYTHGKRLSSFLNNVLYPYIIPARIDKEGNLSTNDSYPWINREYLTPVRSGMSSIILGAMDDYDKYISINDDIFEGWDKYLQHTKNLFYKVTGNNYDELNINNINVINKVYAIPDARVNSTYYLQRLNSYILHSNIKCPLLNNLTNFQNIELKNILTENEILSMSKLHKWQMGNSFPLWYSQRHSLSHLLTTKNGDILAINWPPWTWKTTLIQSIVANLIVESALEGKNPCLILASSTNNQAITNIIESFQNTSESWENNILSWRWLPDVESFAMYCPSKTAYERSKKNNSDYVMMNSFWNWFPELVENNDYYIEAKTIYKRTSEIYFQKKFFSIKEIVRSLHEELENTYQELNQCITHLSRYKICRDKSSFIHWLLNYYYKWKWNTYKDNNNLKNNYPEILDELDTTIRHKLFLLAIHYWEWRWLLETNDKLYKAGDKKLSSKDKKIKDWHRYAMLTPVVVSTFHSAPNFFCYKTINNSEKWHLVTPLLNTIDYLIIDEAWQVSPEISGPIFSLAKKAIVIWDIYQIPPVQKLPSSVDIWNLFKLWIMKSSEEIEYNKISELWILSSNGCLMKVAQRRTYYKLEWHEERGLYLFEHRRCVPEIINYCNKLVYQWDLIPLRPKIDCKNRILPALNSIHVNGKSKSVFGSKSNEEEAITIIDWIQKNMTVIMEYYWEKKIENLIWIITPFVSQKNLIIEKMKNKWIYNSDFKVWTVHALQWAEKPVVLLSTVYAQNEKTRNYFFDQEYFLLNVAVSRARDSFILFWDLNIFDMQKKVPSVILYKHIQDYLSTLSSKDKENMIMT